MVQTYFDGDGLLRKYGPTKTVPMTGGEYRTNAMLRQIEFKIDLTTLTSSPVIQSDQVFFPTGMRVYSVEVLGETAATSSGNGTIDIGLQREDRSTELDYNGFVAAMVKGSVDVAGEVNTLTPGVTYAGALVGTTTANVGYITANYNTAAYQTGVVRVRINYYKP